MKLSCPHCHQHYEIDAAYAGSWITCDNCGKNFAIPAAVAPSDSRECATDWSVSDRAADGHKTPASAQSVTGVELAPVNICPFCGGDIPFGVKKCRHCGSWLSPSQSMSQLSLLIITMTVLFVIAVMCIAKVFDYIIQSVLLFCILLMLITNIAVIIRQNR